MKFEWDEKKSLLNKLKHGVSFKIATKAFDDDRKIIVEDFKHSESEQRYFCFGLCQGEVITIRFTERGDKIRIIGAGYWREGKKFYEQKNKMG